MTIDGVVFEIRHGNVEAGILDQLGKCAAKTDFAGIEDNLIFLDDNPQKRGWALRCCAKNRRCRCTGRNEQGNKSADKAFGNEVEIDHITDRPDRNDKVQSPPLFFQLIMIMNATISLTAVRKNTELNIAVH